MFLGITPVSSVSNGLYFLTLPLVSVMRVIYRKIRHVRYLYIKNNVEKVWGARYISKNMVYFVQNCQLPYCWRHIVNVKMACIRFSVVIF